MDEMLEIVDRRTPNSKEFLVNGVFRQVHIQQGLHYWDRDTARYENSPARVAPNSDVPGFLYRYKGRHWSRFGPSTWRFGFGQGQSITYTFPGNASPAVEGRTVTYADVQTSTDVRLQAYPEGVKETVVLRDASAPPSIAIAYQAEGILLQPTLDGGVRVVGLDGKPAGRISPPKAKDAAGVRGHVFMRVTPTHLVLVVDAEWLADPARVFPVTIDPTTIQPSDATGKDTSADSYDSNANHEREETLETGRMGTWTGTPVFRTFIQFPLDAILTGEGVQLAIMSLYCFDQRVDSPTDVSVKEITSDWVASTLTWNNQPSVGPTLVTTSVGAKLNWYSWDITSLCRDWVAGTKINRGVALYGVEAGDSGRFWYACEHSDPSLRPKLVVTLTAAPTVSPYNPKGMQAYPSSYQDLLSIVLGARYASSAGLAMTARQMQVYDANGNLAWDSGRVAQGRPTPAFTRNSPAYKEDGTQVGTNVPRFENPNKLATEGGGADYDWSKWSHWNSAYWTYTWQADGVFVGKPSGVNTFLFLYECFSVVNGVQYKMAVQLRANKAVNSFPLRAYLYGSGVSGEQTQSVSLTTDWQTFEFTLTASGTSTTVGIGFNFYLPTADVEIQARAPWFGEARKYRRLGPSGGLHLEEGTTNLVSDRNLNNWSKRYGERFTISYANEVNTTSCATAGGWEQLYKSFSVTAGQAYTLSFRYRVRASYSGNVRAQVLNAAPVDNNNSGSQIAYVNIPSAAGDFVATSVTFTPAVSTIYVDFNWGFANDPQNVQIDIGNIQLEAKPYPTTFTDGTRSPDHHEYTLPAPLPNEWLLSLFWKPDQGSTISRADGLALAALHYDANNRIDISYYPSRDVFNFLKLHGGSDVGLASGIVSFSAGDIIGVAISQLTQARGDLVAGMHLWFILATGGVVHVWNTDVNLPTPPTKLYIGGIFVTGYEAEGKVGNVHLIDIAQEAASGTVITNAWVESLLTDVMPAKARPGTIMIAPLQTDVEPVFVETIPGGNLHYGRSYKWRCKVWDAYGGNSAWSDYLWLLSDLTAPTGLVATPDSANAKIDLSWNQHTGESLVGYNVYRKKSADTDFEKLNVVLVTTASYVDRAVATGQSYDYKVAAVAADGYVGAQSNADTNNQVVFTDWWLEALKLEHAPTALDIQFPRKVGEYDVIGSVYPVVQTIGPQGGRSGRRLSLAVPVLSEAQAEAIIAELDKGMVALRDPLGRVWRVQQVEPIRATQAVGIGGVRYLLVIPLREVAKA